ncbi:hypothetical protein DTO013F2_8432 [Penicillium roqueforti]|nr:hypothetical protein DTO013F2_8432 [Penicillium roqueforti]
MQFDGFLEIPDSVRLSTRRHSGAAVTALDGNLETVESQQAQVGPMDRWSVYVAELIGIFYAISGEFRIAHQRQPVVHGILQGATEFQAQRIALHLQWMPGHCHNPGNDAADRPANDAARPGETHPFRPLLSRETARLRGNILTQWEQEWRSSNKGSTYGKSTAPRSNLHEKAIWKPAQELGIPIDTASHLPQLVIYLR